MMLESTWSIVMIVATAVVPMPSVDDLSLEPCINGGVSAHGAHIDQAAEDLSRFLDALQIFDATELSWNPARFAALEPRRQSMWAPASGHRWA